MPSERHTHYDAEGNQTGYTIVEREPRIDDADRVEILGLALHDAQVCPGCGWHPIFADDPDANFAPETRYCQTCAGRDAMSRILADEDKRVPHDAPPRNPRPSDGKHVQIRLLGKLEEKPERPKKSE